MRIYKKLLDKSAVLLFFAITCHSPADFDNCCQYVQNAPECDERLLGLLANSKYRNPPFRPESERMRWSLTISSANFVLKSSQSHDSSILAGHVVSWWLNKWSNILKNGVSIRKSTGSWIQCAQDEAISDSLQRRPWNRPTLYKISGDGGGLAG